MTFHGPFEVGSQPVRFMTSEEVFAEVVGSSTQGI